jgi:hypothetical protein
MDSLALAAPTAFAADRLAQHHFRCNRSAIESTQPDLIKSLRTEFPAITWLFSRDGYLSAQTESRWLTNCSVPILTARQLIKKLELDGTVGCFLNPTHAAQLRACFEKLKPTQAVVAVVPDPQTLNLILHCDDFTQELSNSRLFFSAGETWPQMLAEIFQSYPGLPLPQHFIRTALLDDAEMSPLSSEAQTIISGETTRRADLMPEILSRAESRPFFPSPCTQGEGQGGGSSRCPKISGQIRTARVLVLAGSRLNLDDFSNLALRRALVDDTPDPAFTALDPDHPTTASPLALAQAAADADAFICADLYRSDLPGLVARRTAWITWLTTGRILPPDPQFPSDLLLLANPDFRKPALEAGWPRDRIHLAAWPQILPPRQTSNALPFVAIVTDTRPIEIPQHVKDFSSQLLLWELIENELTRDPLTLGSDPDRYLDSRMARMKISPEGFDRPMFFEKLITPTFKLALARLLLKQNIPLRLIGRGWSEFPDLKLLSAGPVQGLDDLSEFLSNCSAIIRASPRPNPTNGTLSVHEINPAGLSSNELLRKTRDAMKSKHRPPINTFEPLCPSALLNWIAKA